MRSYYGKRTGGLVSAWRASFFNGRRLTIGLREFAKSSQSLWRRFASSRNRPRVSGAVSRVREIVLESLASFREFAKSSQSLWRRFASSRNHPRVSGAVSRVREIIPESLASFHELAMGFFNKKRTRKLIPVLFALFYFRFRVVLGSRRSLSRSPACSGGRTCSSCTPRRPVG